MPEAEPKKDDAAGGDKPKSVGALTKIIAAVFTAVVAPVAVGLGLKYLSPKENSENPPTSSVASSTGAVIVPASAPTTTPSLPPETQRRPFVLAFNGKNLDGWTSPTGTPAPSWTVRDGVVLNHIVGENLVSKAIWGDFELELEFMLPLRCNSGIYLRGRYEIQLLDTAGEEEWRNKPGSKFAPNQSCGALFGQIAPTANVYKGPNRCNSLNVVVTGKHLTVVMNDTRIVVGEITKPTSQALFSDNGTTGPIVVQSIAPVSGAQFRNIRVRKLD